MLSTPRPSSPADNVQADLQTARQALTEAQTEAARTRNQLAALTEKRQGEESTMASAKQRVAALTQEEAELRAAAMKARREGGEGREAATAARSELTELREAVDKERRELDGFRDRALAVEAEIARKKEEDRFTREKADAQQARLDEIKREVWYLVRDLENAIGRALLKRTVVVFGAHRCRENCRALPLLLFCVLLLAFCTPS